jgi:dipeptidyl aminopeptidase/acylaminoacyl peptidase
VLGGSYGGYLTSWLVGHTDRFAAACSERAVDDMESEELASDAAGYFHYEIGVDPSGRARGVPADLADQLRPRHPHTPVDPALG